MIRKLITHFLHGKLQRLPAGKGGKPSWVEASDFGLRAQAISVASLKTVQGLQSAGYKAYIVGGAVRDLLLGYKPKDFDVATDATPEEVRHCFRRSRLIGRRFQIVHVYMRGEVVEVTTFRGEHTAKTDPQGRILHDNAFGDQAEDAARRDFSINALYYDPVDELIIDYFQGVADIRQRRLRIIGNPSRRYREDPVRILRAVRLAAKLDLQIDPNTAAPLTRLAPLLENVPPARRFDELVKLVASGAAHTAISALRDRLIHPYLLPGLDAVLTQKQGERFVECALANTDARVAAGKAISANFIFATLLWPLVLDTWRQHQEAGERPLPALFHALDDVFEQHARRLAITRRIGTDVREILGLQPRFEQRSGKRPYALLTRPRFRAAYDFLLLRAEVGEVDSQLAEWWTRFQNADGSQRADMIDALQPAQTDNKRRPRRRRRKQPASNTTFVQ